MKITILTPVYNDWKSASKLIEEINTIVKDLDAEFSLVIVNDASTEEKPTTISSTENLSSIEILNIKNNQGHGRCIATGLKHIFQNKEFDYVIPMDGDGEDRPEELNSLFKHNLIKSTFLDLIVLNSGRYLPACLINQIDLQEILFNKIFLILLI